MNPFNTANITRGKFTTIVGFLIILASVVSVFYPGVSWTEAAVGFGVGAAFLGLPDPKGPKAGAAAAVLGMLVLAGCASYQRCLDKYGNQVSAAPVVEVSDTVAVPVSVTTKADSLTASLDIDSLATSWSRDTVRMVSAGGRAEVLFYKSPAGDKLQARVNVPPQVIHDTVKVFVTLQAKCPPAYTLQKKEAPPWYEPYWGHYKTFSAYVLSAGLVLLLGLILVRRRR